MIYIIEIASADQVDIREFGIESDKEATKYPSDKWEEVAQGSTPLEALEFLLMNANAEEFDISNSWLRLVIYHDDGHVEVKLY
jgi:hypothetical protein